MPDDISDIRAFYDSNVDKEEGRLARHPIEHDITWRYLEKYLPPSGKILDIGAGTGAYAIPLAERGYTVTAADLSPELIGTCQKKIENSGLSEKITCLVADARDLSAVTENDFDAVLLFGPLYHLVLEEERKMAIRGAFKRLKPGGILFSSFISRYSFWLDIMKIFPYQISKHKYIESVLETGWGEGLPLWDAVFRAYFATVPEIAPLHEQLGFKTLALAGLEPVGAGSEETYKNLTEEQRKPWLDLLVKLSTEQSIIGASAHILYVGEKTVVS
jgi:SAM-dependent methyltransferase